MQSPGIAIPSSALNFNTTVGAIYIALIICTILHGITIVQVYTFNRLSNDRWPLKATIICVWLLETLHLALFVYAMYPATITSFTDVGTLNKISWITIGMTVVETVMNAVVRSLFCLRIWRLSCRNNLLVFPIAVATIVNFVIGIVASMQEPIDEITFMWGNENWLIYTSNATGVLADICISASQAILLLRQRSNFPKTNRALRILVLYSINTGLLVTLCAIASLVTFAVMPHNEIWQAVCILLAPLLFNCLLAAYTVKWSLQQDACSTSPISQKEQPYFSTICVAPLSGLQISLQYHEHPVHSTTMTTTEA